MSLTLGHRDEQADKVSKSDILHNETGINMFSFWWLKVLVMHGWMDF